MVSIKPGTRHGVGEVEQPFGVAFEAGQGGGGESGRGVQGSLRRCAAIAAFALLAVLLGVQLTL